MTVSDIQRAMLAIFAVREAGQGASVEQMRAIAMCVRNRVRQGWHDGDWIKVMEHADDTRANLPGVPVKINGDDRNFQRFVRDIEEIYFSRRDYSKDPTRAAMPDLDEAVGNSCYWAFLNKPFTSWFTEHVLDDVEHHKQKAAMGTMLFYE